MHTLAVPTAVAELQKSSDTLKENLKESIDLLDEIIKTVPESNLKNTFKACLVNINAADALIQKPLQQQEKQIWQTLLNPILE